MRKIVLGVGISLDGYIARPDGSVDFLFMPKDYSMAPFFKRVDTAIMGRKTYEVGLKMSKGKFYTGGMACYVFSRTMTAGADEVTFVSDPPGKFVDELRKKTNGGAKSGRKDAKPEKDIWLMGGGELTRELLREDLVDEIYLGVVPVLIGEGIPAFPAGFPQSEWTLAENKSYSKGLIALRYERARKGARAQSNAKKR